MLFGKNSDRQRNEAQLVEIAPSMQHLDGAFVACTYVKIPQVRRTNAVLLSRPFWTWGAEMGANEFGVVIGNEGLQSRVAPPIEPALIGMDLVRLALERSTSAEEAVDVITQLLANCGQGGDCGHLTPAYYNNGFIIADCDRAYVLETIGREWLLERVDGTRSLSNSYSITGTTDGMSAGLERMMQANGWTDTSRGYFAAIGDPNREHLGNARARRSRSTQLLCEYSGSLEAIDIIRILRDHGTLEDWRPSASGRTLCMHAGGHDKPGQTTGSLVSDVSRSTSVHWVTATAAPCISVFKPLFLDAPLPDHGPKPTDQADQQSLWWRHESFHRDALSCGLPEVLEQIVGEREALEADFHHRVATVADGGDETDKALVVEHCWAEADRHLKKWSGRLPAIRLPEPPAFHQAWSTMDRIAKRSSWPSRQLLEPTLERTKPCE